MSLNGQRMLSPVVLEGLVPAMPELLSQGARVTVVDRVESSLFDAEF
ncbi:MAG: hypothetical protein R3B83_03705 [Nitrospirales bacterium]|nr:hypothetical protein [Nitrospirales bacterium]